jgi:hypothetical protein
MAPRPVRIEALAAVPPNTPLTDAREVMNWKE